LYVHNCILLSFQNIGCYNDKSNYMDMIGVYNLNLKTNLIYFSKLHFITNLHINLNIWIYKIIAPIYELFAKQSNLDSCLKCKSFHFLNMRAKGWFGILLFFIFQKFIVYSYVVKKCFQGVLESSFNS